jgi:ATP-dependent RNA helicase RhlE
VARQATASENISQSVVMFKGTRKDREGSQKRQLLRALIDQEGDALTNAIIFCNRKTDVDICAKSLNKYGYQAAPIHGDLDQAQRMKTLDDYREGRLKFLVASDVAARGLDIPSVSHVFNFDVPGHAEDYVHRIGRTGRAGRSGSAFMICAKRDEKAFAAVEALIQKEITRLDIPAALLEEWAPKKKPAREKPSEPVQTSEPKPDPSEKPAQQNRRRRDRRGNDNTVVGMGDHMPSFIALSFEERRAS